MKVPFDRSYWVVPGKFLAGCYPDATRFDEEGRKLKGLLNADIRSIINLTEENETDWQGDVLSLMKENIRVLAETRGTEVRYLRIPVPD